MGLDVDQRDCRSAFGRGYPRGPARHGGLGIGVDRWHQYAIWRRLHDRNGTGYARGPTAVSDHWSCQDKVLALAYSRPDRDNGRCRPTTPIVSRHVGPPYEPVNLSYFTVV